VVKVHLGPKDGFPESLMNATNYTVELNFGQGTHELGYVMKAEAVDSSHKTQVLHLKSLGNKFRFNHFATGTLISSMTGDYDDMVG
jgi:hypothetical protein